MSLCGGECLILQPELALPQEPRPERRNNLCLAKNNGTAQAVAAPPKAEDLDCKPAALVCSGKNNAWCEQLVDLGDWILAGHAVLAMSDGSEGEAQVSHYDII